MFASTFRATASKAVKRAFLSRSCVNVPGLRTRLSARSLWTGLAFAGAGVAGLTTYYASVEPLKLDDSPDAHEHETISVDNSISPFPVNISCKLQTNLHADFQLLGYGVRSVTFLSFKVYGIGLYIATADVDRARKILKQETDLPKALKDPVSSQRVVTALLDSGVRFMVRICPVRNTDFGHLKDGITKSILANPLSKENREITSQGLEQLRVVFLSRRGSVPKNHLLYIEIGGVGKLLLAYENPVKHEIIEMGTVSEPQLSKTLFSLYMSGPKPLSGPLRDSCVEGLLGLSDGR